MTKYLHTTYPDVDPALPLDCSRTDKKAIEKGCDMCHGKPTAIFASSRTSTGDIQDCWRWVVCRKCCLLIERGNWSKLETIMAAATNSNGLRERLAEAVKTKIKDAVWERQVGEAVMSVMFALRTDLIEAKPKAKA